jgi:hypothetical protein
MPLYGTTRANARASNIFWSPGTSPASTPSRHSPVIEGLIKKPIVSSGHNDARVSAFRAPLAAAPRGPVAVSVRRIR